MDGETLRPLIRQHRLVRSLGIRLYHQPAIHTLAKLQWKSKRTGPGQRRRLRWLVSQQVKVHLSQTRIRELLAQPFYHASRLSMQHPHALRQAELQHITVNTAQVRMIFSLVRR